MVTVNNGPTLQRMLVLAQRLRGLKAFVQDALEQLVEQHGDYLVEANRRYMAEQGQTVKGDSIQAKGYSEAYKTYKQRYARYKNVAFVDLKAMGKFHASLYLNYEGALTWRIKSADTKAKMLEMRYGNLLGIREQDAQAFVEDIILPRLKARIDQYLTV